VPGFKRGVCDVQGRTSVAGAGCAEATNSVRSYRRASDRCSLNLRLNPVTRHRQEGGGVGLKTAPSLLVRSSLNLLQSECCFRIAPQSSQHPIATAGGAIVLVADRVFQIVVLMIVLGWVERVGRGDFGVDGLEVVL